MTCKLLNEIQPAREREKETEKERERERKKCNRDLEALAGIKFIRVKFCMYECVCVYV